MSWSGGPVGVLIGHGFTSTPQSVAPWGQALASYGHTVRIPLLPGHGTRWPDLNRVTWHDWYNTLSEQLDELLTCCDQVVVAGQSLGGALALRLAQERSPDIAGVMVANPAVLLTSPEIKLVPFLQHFLPAVPGVAGDIKQPGQAEVAYRYTPLKAVHSMLDLMAKVRADMHKVTTPLLLAYTDIDHVVPRESIRYVRNHVASDRVQELRCAASYHVVTLDYDAQLLCETSDKFIAEHVAGGVTP